MRNWKIRRALLCHNVDVTRNACHAMNWLFEMLLSTAKKILHIIVSFLSAILAIFTCCCNERSLLREALFLHIMYLLMCRTGAALMSRKLWQVQLGRRF